MAIVVIGGHSRNIGKTSVVAGLIAALPAYDWTAFKITQFGHTGHPAQSERAGTRWTIIERDSSGKGDTSRFLVAGAKAAFLVEAEEGRLREATPAIQEKFAEAENVIVESNSILEFIQPDLYITVLDPATEDFKASAQKYLEKADAVVMHESAVGLQWQGISREGIAGRPVFSIAPPPYVNADLVEFVSQRLKVKSESLV